MPENMDPSLAAYNQIANKDLVDAYNQSKVGAEMPRYRSHKEVHALKIAHVEHLRTDTTTEENPIVRIHFVNTRFAPLDMNLRGKPTPDVGWYYVVYEDGYKSFSPAQAFDEGYTLIA